MKILLDIREDKAAFILELLKNFKYVKAEPLESYKGKEVTTRRPGGLLRLNHLRGKKLSIPDDFNKPLNDLKDYM